jgi:hypothetical protein
VTVLHRLASIARWIVRRHRAERDLNDELEAFVEMAAADRISDGVAPAEARRLARLHLGGVEQAKERVRSARHGAWLDEVGRDFHYGLRQRVYTGYDSGNVLVAEIRLPDEPGTDPCARHGQSAAFEGNCWTGSAHCRASRQQGLATWRP